LAANNISAQQIRDDYQQRRAQAEADADEEDGAGPSNANNEGNEDDNDEPSAEAAAAAIARSKKRRQEVQDEAISKIKSKKGKAKGKGKDKGKDKDKEVKANPKGKGKGKGKKKARGSDDDDDESELSEYDSDATAQFAGYKKAVKLPGQLENCELCSKRFTVTPYSKSGPDGGLLCTPCGKELGKEAEKAKKEQKKKAGPVARKRRKIESDKMDGKVLLGAKTLQQLCLEKASSYAEDVDDLGDLPDRQMKRLSEIFTKKRVMKSKTFPLFLQPDNEQVIVHDCACKSRPCQARNSYTNEFQILTTKTSYGCSRHLPDYKSWSSTTPASSRTQPWST
jgi:DNA repair protein RAD7